MAACDRRSGGGRVGSLWTSAWRSARSRAGGSPVIASARSAVSAIGAAAGFELHEEHRDSHGAHPRVRARFFPGTKIPDPPVDPPQCHPKSGHRTPTGRDGVPLLAPFRPGDVPLLFPPLPVRVSRFRALGGSALIAMGMSPSLSASQQEVARKVGQRFPLSAHGTDFTLNSATSFDWHLRRQVYTSCRSASRVATLCLVAACEPVRRATRPVAQEHVGVPRAPMPATRSIARRPWSVAATAGERMGMRAAREVPQR